MSVFCAYCYKFNWTCLNILKMRYNKNQTIPTSLSPCTHHCFLSNSLLFFKLLILLFSQNSFFACSSFYKDEVAWTFLFHIRMSIHVFLVQVLFRQPGWLTWFSVISKILSRQTDPFQLAPVCNFEVLITFILSGIVGRFFCQDH